MNWGSFVLKCFPRVSLALSELLSPHQMNRWDPWQQVAASRSCPGCHQLKSYWLSTGIPATSQLVLNESGCVCVCVCLVKHSLFDLVCLFCGNWTTLLQRRHHECCVSLPSSEPDDGAHGPTHLSLRCFCLYFCLSSSYCLLESFSSSSSSFSNPDISSSLKAQTRHVPGRSAAALPPPAPPPSRPARPPATPAAPPARAPPAATRPSPSASSRRRRWRWSGPRPSLLPPSSGSWRFSISPCLTWRM